MAAVEVQELPFRQLSDKAGGIVEEIQDLSKQLRVVLRDVEAAERNRLYEAADKRGEDLFEAALRVVDRARYVLNVAEAQHIGNTSEAWHVGIRELNAALDEVDSLTKEVEDE